MRLTVTQLCACAALSLSSRLVRREDPVLDLGDPTDLVAGVKEEDLKPPELTGSGEEMDGAIPDVSDPAVPTVPVGTDLEKVGQSMAVEQANELAEPPQEGEQPTFAPLDAHPQEQLSVDDLTKAASDATAGEKDVVTREGMADCDCACCMSVERVQHTPSSNYTCTTVPAYLVNPPEDLTDKVLPDASTGSPVASTKCYGVDTATGGQCASIGAGKDLDEPKEPLAHELFCATHCKAVENKNEVPCLALSDSELSAAWKDGTWTDPLVPSVQEAQLIAYNAAQAMEEPPLKPHLQKVKDIREAKSTLEDLGPPVEAADKALVNSGGDSVL